jgi:hypothetical protein
MKPLYTAAPSEAAHPSPTPLPTLPCSPAQLGPNPNLDGNFLFPAEKGLNSWSSSLVVLVEL